VVKERNAKVFKFPKVERKLTERVLKCDISQLQQLLKKGEVTSEQLVSVFGERTQKIGRALHYTCDELFEHALQRARELDRQRKQLPEVGPLFGIPFCIKDTFHVKNFRGTSGNFSMANSVSQETAEVVRKLEAAGVIVLVKANCPQMSFGFNTDSFWGEAVSPFKQERSVGGSSGGDAALVATHCAPCGFGQDIGGSVRSPALFNGVVGFKATANRISAKGSIKLGHMGEPCPSLLHLAQGPISETVEDAKLVFEVLVNGDNHDPMVPPTPFNHQMHAEAQKPKKTKIGFIKSLEILPASKATQRAVELAVKALETLGFEVVPFEFSYAEQVEIYSLFLKTMTNFDFPQTHTVMD